MERPAARLHALLVVLAREPNGVDTFHRWNSKARWPQPFAERLYAHRRARPVRNYWLGKRVRITGR